MSIYTLSHVADGVLLRDLAAHVARERGATALVLAHIAEVEARKLYVPAPHPSMHSYCVHVLHLSEDAADRRIRAARVAREHPAVFLAIAEGRLNLSTVLALGPHLTAGNADELIVAADRRTYAEVLEGLAKQFPRTEPLPLVQPMVARPGPMATATSRSERDADSPAISRVRELSRPRIEPLSRESYSLCVTLERADFERLRYAEQLLGQSVRSGDLAKVLSHALVALVRELEKKKFGTGHGGPKATGRRPATNTRHIPLGIRRAVWERDGGRCTFVSDVGHRCPARRALEFDHIEPVARGGETTSQNLRLRCRAQWLRKLGYGAAEARRAASHCDTSADPSMEDRVRQALAFLRPPHRVERPAAVVPG